MRVIRLPLRLQRLACSTGLGADCRATCVPKLRELKCRQVIQCKESRAFLMELERDGPYGAHRRWLYTN